MRPNQTQNIYGVALLSMSVPCDHYLYSRSTYLLDYSSHLKTLKNDLPQQGTNLMRIVKTTNDSVFTVTFIIPDHTNVTNHEDDLFSLLNQLGYTNIQKLKIQYYPNHGSTKIGNLEWYQKVEKVQGIGNIYFTGELFSGHGVPTVFLHSKRWTMKTFGLTEQVIVSSKPEKFVQMKLKDINISKVQLNQVFIIV